MPDFRASMDLQQPPAVKVDRKTANTFWKYNLRWPKTVDPASAELDMIAHGGMWKKSNGELAGNGLDYHFKEFIRIVWPDVVFHKWFELILNKYHTHRSIAILGPASCNTTGDIGPGGDAIPSANYSSESPDAVSFFGRNYGPGNNPPLGTSWVASSCVGTCVSLISQADADSCAARANISCLATDWPVTEPNPNPEGDPFITTPRPTFLNEPQTCSITCPDGNIFSYTVPAGTVEAFSLAAANASAHSIACNRASDSRICIGNPSISSGCVGDQFITTVDFTALKPPVLVELFNLPAGLSYTFTDSFVTILGIPDTAGEYLVTIHITDDFGGVMDKIITLGFLEIFPDTLADAEVDEVYSQALSVVGPTVGDVVWSVASGTLPTGLTLNPSTGEISGTPTDEGTFSFTIRMSDDQ